MTTMITVSDSTIRVNGIQFGPTFACQMTAISEGIKIKEKHYPTAIFKADPIPPPPPPKIVTEKKTRKTRKKIQ